jgi:GDP-4-dehydro-6-deoxy-D-mannose reductase
VGNLSTRREISDIRDVLRAMWRIFEAGDPTKPVNVARGETYSIQYLADELVKMARVPVEVVVDPKLLRPTDEPDNRADITRLRALGYAPSFAIERTLRDALEYWRQPATNAPP